MNDQDYSGVSWIHDQGHTAGYASGISGGWMIRVILLSLEFLIRVILLDRPQEYHVDAVLGSYWSHGDAWSVLYWWLHFYNVRWMPDQGPSGCMIRVLLLARPLKYQGGFMIRVILVSPGFLIRVMLLARPLEYQVYALLGSYWSYMELWSVLYCWIHLYNVRWMHDQGLATG